MSDRKDTTNPAEMLVFIMRNACQPFSFKWEEPSEDRQLKGAANGQAQ